MLGACTDCDQITDTEQYPYFFSLCSECWEKYKAGIMELWQDMNYGNDIWKEPTKPRA